MTRDLFIFLGVFVSSFTGSAEAAFSGNPGTEYVHENEDGVVNLWYISTSCTVDCSYYTTCSYGCYDGETYTTCYYRCYRSCTTTLICNQCQLTSNPSSLFQMSGRWVQKKSCSLPGCGPTCSASGCTNAGETYTVGVECWRTGYNTDGRNSDTFTVSITQNAAPTFSFSAGNNIDVFKSSSGENSVVNRMVATDSDAYIDGDSIVYTQASPPGPSWIHGNTLFALNTANGEIYVTRSLDFEFSYYYTMRVCVHDRREDQTCQSLSITLHACFQTPNCSDQSNHGIWDTFGTHTGHGDTNILFVMTSPLPDHHFPDFHTGWHELQWTLDFNDLDVAVIDYYTGVIETTANISIYPAWRSKAFSMIVKVGNSESCYTTTCNIEMTVWYTNWPIEIRSLPAEIWVEENNDAEIHLQDLVVYDYNYAEEDNVTCYIASITPNAENLFELRNDTLLNWNSYKLYRLECQTPDCGYKYSTSALGPYFCDLDKGCLNYDTHDQYEVRIKCDDGYGSSDEEVFTFHVIENQAPVWRNLDNTIVLNSDDVGDADTIFSIMYTDNEDDFLIYEYTFTPDPGFFAADANGNYFNNLANISLTLHQWDQDNQTYLVHINAHERRNEIDGYLTIYINDYCGPTPDCSPLYVPVTTEFPVGGELFSAGLTNPSGFTASGLSFSFASSQQGYFKMDASTGSVTTTTTLPANYPYTIYSFNVFVYYTGSCSYGHCSVSVEVTPVNYDISITNLGAGVRVQISEDTSASTSLYVITTSDDNPDDTVNCQVTSISPPQTDGSPDLFYAQATIPGSNLYVVMSRDSPGFTSATTLYTVTVACSDSQGSTDTGDLEVEVILNQGPSLTNLDLPTTVTVDPATQTAGYIIYEIEASDPENDAIKYNCSVADTFVPLECVSDSVIRLRRNVDHVTENHAQYAIGVCVGDAKHPNNDCGQLLVTINSSRTNPEISNLPATVTFAEDTAVGTSLYQLGVNDQDVGDVHSYILTEVEPADAYSAFTLNASEGLVSLGTPFDYETVSSYSLTFSVRDEHLSALSKSVLTVLVTNVNEIPSISTNNYLFSFDEDAIIGTEFDEVEFMCIDPDSPDTATFSITSGVHAGYFGINSTTGQISLTQQWDLESGLPGTTEFQVTCTDSGGLTSSLTMNAIINDVNEFSPSISVSSSIGINPGSAGNPILVSSSTSLIEDLLTISATDNDLGGAVSFVFRIIGNGIGRTYFTMFSHRLTKRSTGAVVSASLRLAASLNFITNRTLVFTIQVSDGELTNGYPVTVVYTADGQAAPSAAEDKCVTCSSTGRSLLAVLIVEGVIVTGILGHIVHHCCTLKKATPEPQRKRLRTIPSSKVTPVSIRSRREVAIEMVDISSSSSDSDSNDSDDSGRELPTKKRTNPSLGNESFNTRFKQRNSTGLPNPIYATSGLAVSQITIHPGSATSRWAK